MKQQIWYCFLNNDKKIIIQNTEPDNFKEFKKNRCKKCFQAPTEKIAQMVYERYLKTIL